MRKRDTAAGTKSRAAFALGQEAAGGQAPSAGGAASAGQPAGDRQRALARRHVARRWHWRRTLVIVVLMYAVVTVAEQQVALHMLNGAAARYQDQIERIRAENSLLRQQLSELSSPAAVEREARAMGLTKPGEVVYEPVWPSR